MIDPVENVNDVYLNILFSLLAVFSRFLLLLLSHLFLVHKFLQVIICILLWVTFVIEC